MRLLLDTQVVLWSLDRPERLTPAVVAALVDPRNAVEVSVVALWEISIKQSIGKLSVDGDLRDRIAAQSFTELPVTGEHAVAVRDLPLHHRDPFDRMLVAQARCEGLTLVTADRALTAYGVPVLDARS